MSIRKTARSMILVGMALAIFSAVPAWTEEETMKATEANGVQRLTILLDSYFYKPKRVVVQSGVPVELTLISQTFLTPHNFVLKEAEAGLTVNQEISAGETVIVRFTPAKPGSYTFYCDKKLLFFKSHIDKGMEGTLTVQ
jgi:plastocyanin domain-containing protein